MSSVELYNTIRQRKTLEEVELHALAADGAERVESKAVRHRSKQMDSLRKVITIGRWEQYTTHRDLSWQ